MSLNICQYLKKFQSLSWINCKIFIILAVIISGCSGVQSKELSLSKKSQYYQLKEGSVYDGDTFRVIDPNGQELKLRVACIDAPEKKQALGIESRDYLRSLLAKNPNKLIVVEKEREGYGRMVAEIFVPTGKGDEEIPISGMMIKEGMAYYYAQYSKNCSDNAERYAQLEKEAKRSRVGVWKNPNAMKPSEFRKRARQK
jgi:endonuclease YncB( thermonuclease family)